MQQYRPDARHELAELDERRNQLINQIEQAELVRRSHTAKQIATRERLTLHQALVVVLTDHANRWMTVRELAKKVNERDLYRKKDGSEVEANQVHARTKNYDKLFEKDGPNVRLRTEPDEQS
jgi:alkaline phosphatase